METAAHALAALLRRVQKQPKNTLYAWWATVLGAEPQSSDFVRKFAEVQELVAETIRLIDGIPNARQRERFNRLYPAWWRSISAPDAQWNATQAARTLIAQDHLDQLESAADILATHYAGTTAAVRADTEAMQTLHEQCALWVQHLQDDTELPIGLRLALLGNFRNAIWLIDNSNLFGEARAVAAVAAAAKDVVFESAPHASPATVRANKRRYVATATAVAVAIGATATALNQSVAAIEKVTSFYQSVTDPAGIPQLPVPPGEQPDVAVEGGSTVLESPTKPSLLD